MKKYILFGPEARYPESSWWENYMSGHITIKLPFGSHVTMYGENAMHWQVDWRVGGAYLCFRLPFRCFGLWWPLFLYYSPDGTPGRAFWKIGKIA
jgi:hypothetical protein